MKKYIKMNGIADVTEFVKQASKVNGDILVRRGKFVVDGTSLLGMFSVDTSQGIEVEFPNSANEGFIHFLEKFESEV